MAHTYATLAEANDYIMAGGSTTLATDSPNEKIATLESVSRRIDGACHRSQFGSGFGPRTGTNKYDGDGTNLLLLSDDLQGTPSAFTVASVTAGTGTAVTVDTDYFLGTPSGYDGPPWRTVLLHGQGSVLYFGPGYRTVSITGSWGYPAESRATGLTVASGLSVGTTATTFTASGSGLSIGHTILVESEQLYVTGVSGTTITVTRGANGTTAATHADASAITRYVYDGRVHDVCLRLFMRRWKSRDAGADGTDGGLDIPGQNVREGEDTIIRRGLSDLLLVGYY